LGESEGTLSLYKMSGILLRRNYSLLGELAAVAGGEAYCHTTLVCRQPAAHACFHYRLTFVQIFSGVFTLDFVSGYHEVSTHDSASTVPAPVNMTFLLFKYNIVKCGTYPGCQLMI
jgi:hypothetical protein